MTCGRTARRVSESFASSWSVHHIRWKLQKQLLGRRQAGQRWVDHFTSALVDKLVFTRCVSAPQFFWSPERQVEMEVRMEDVHGSGRDPQVEKFKEDLAAHIWFRDGGVHHDGAEYDHLKRFRKKFNGVMTIESNPKYLDAVLDLLGLAREKDVRADAQCEVSLLGSMLGSRLEAR